MSEGRAHIIDGRVFDAGQQARRILDEARAEAERVRQRAYAELRQYRAATSRSSQGSDQTTQTGFSVGVVRDVYSAVIRVDVDGVRLGEILDIHVGDDDSDHRADGDGPPRFAARVVPVEVVEIRGGEVLALPLAEAVGVAPGCPVVARGNEMTVACSPELLGRVLDGVGRVLDDGSEHTETVTEAVDIWPVQRSAPGPLTRPRIHVPVATGVRVIDGLLTLGRGQRVGLLAGPGVGKSSLLGRITNAADVDVCVVCLVGERGREVREFVDARLTPERRRRTVVVCATSDAPCLTRVRAAHVATAIAEWFRDRQGAHVLLVMDSLTRLARAQRDVGLSLGHMPVRHGFPASVFTLLPRLIERAGTAQRGSITAVYTVLTSSDELADPIAEEVRSLVDGHIVLSAERARRGRWPPIDVVRSISRVMNQVITPAHRRSSARIRELLAVHREYAELIAMGAYQPGSEPVLDVALAAMPEMEQFACHEQPVAYEQCVTELTALAARFSG